MINIIIIVPAKKFQKQNSDKNSLLNHFPKLAAQN
jgi:hypothetical protein